jgi:hypothetical protein
MCQVYIWRINEGKGLWLAISLTSLQFQFRTNVCQINYYIFFFRSAIVVWLMICSDSLSWENAWMKLLGTFYEKGLHPPRLWSTTSYTWRYAEILHHGYVMIMCFPFCCNLQVSTRCSKFMTSCCYSRASSLVPMFDAPNSCFCCSFQSSFYHFNLFRCSNATINNF